jgi:hypothetical protein
MTQENYDEAMTYEAYINYAKERFALGKTTGTSEEFNTAFYLHYTKMNLSRTKRIERTAVISEEVKLALDKIKTQQNWLVLAESWCGDVPHNLPLIMKMVDYQPLLKLKLLLRDENLEVMDAYLTKGGRSIPKLIVFDEYFKTELFTWGPRPAALQGVIEELKLKEIPYTEIAEITQKWYNQDKGTELQKEFLALFRV